MSGTAIALAITGLMAAAGTIVFRSSPWRIGILFFAAISMSGAILEIVTELLLTSTAHGTGLHSVFEPSEWLQKDQDLGYRPRPQTRVKATSTFDGEQIYSVHYSINADGSRWTPPAEATADIYLFVGDSFMFGQGLRDDETVPSQFAKGYQGRLHTALFAAPGYGPNHFLRMIEAEYTASLDRSRVKAVVTWIIPAHLSRVTGDESWLGGSPRYSIEHSPPQFTGSFDTYRRAHPWLAVSHWVTERFAFLSAIGEKQREENQARTFGALMLQMQKLVNEKFHAPLVVLYSWPDRNSPTNYAGFGDAQPRLVSILEDLRSKGLRLVELNSLGYGLPNDKILIPHDGHPTAFTDSLVAEKLRRHLLDGEAYSQH